MAKRPPDTVTPSQVRSSAADIPAHVVDRQRHVLAARRHPLEQSRTGFGGDFKHHFVVCGIGARAQPNPDRGPGGGPPDDVATTLLVGLHPDVVCHVATFERVARHEDRSSPGGSWRSTEAEPEREREPEREPAASAGSAGWWSRSVWAA